MPPRPTTILGLATLVALLATPLSARACRSDASASCCATVDTCRCCPAETPTAAESAAASVVLAARSQLQGFVVPATRQCPIVTPPSCFCRVDRPTPAPVGHASPTGPRPSDDRTTFHADLPAPPTAAGPPSSHAVATTRDRPPDIPAYLRSASWRC